MFKIPILLISIFLVSCEKTDFEKHEDLVLEKLGWLYDANPYQDAAKAIADNDFRFIGFIGNGLHVPVVSRDCLDQETQIKFIGGSTHSTDGYEHLKLATLANLYAREFNTVIYSHITEHKGFKCPNT